MKPSSDQIQKIKVFLQAQHYGVLSTYSAAVEGYPFGSLVQYVFDASSNQLLIYIATIAEHYKNLTANQRACLFVFESAPSEDPQSQARVSLLTTFKTVLDSERKAAEEDFQLAFPDSMKQDIAMGFVFMRGGIEKIRWIGGFGAMGWLDGADF